MSTVKLWDAEFEVLDHTIKRAARGRYCGKTRTVENLVARGLMKSVGSVSWCPDEYFVITDAGRAAHAEHVGATHAK